jgi:GPH family glycoside/pentoside/hexuronide:cation symporter
MVERPDPGVGKMIAYGSANFPAGMLLLIVAVWLMRLYCPSEDEVGRTLLIDPWLFGIVSASVMFVAAFTDVLVGFWSDRSQSPSGRRQPFMRWGLPFLALSFMFLWFPPAGERSPWNIAWLVVMLGTLHVAFTVVVNPYLALMPEVWRSESGRIRVSAWMAGFNALSQVFGFVVFGVLIDSFMNGGEIFGVHIPDGFKVAAVLGAIITVVFFYPTLTRIKETPHSLDKEVPFGLVESALQTLKNPAFLPYIISGSMLYAAQFMIQAALPFLVVTQIVDDPAKGDLIASLILLGLVVFTALLFPVVDRVSRRFKKTHLYMASLLTFVVTIPLATLAGSIPGIPGMAHLIVVCIFIAPGLAIGLVIPRAILADVMDYDTQRTGYRREAMYNGMEGLIQKIAGGLAPLLQGFLFSAFGYSRERPLGIILCGAAAGLLALAGFLAFLKYPLKK